MRVWVIRHGESETNRDGLWTGWLDVPLTDKGREDAVAARRVLSGVQFDKIYTSDLQRAETTAEIAIPGCQYAQKQILREINVGNLAGNPLSAVMDQNNRPMNCDGYGSFGGETKEAFSNRVATFIRSLESEDCENIAVFSHGGFLRKFLDLVVGTELPRKHICCNNCAVAIFEYNDSVWQLHSWINKLIECIS